MTEKTGDTDSGRPDHVDPDARPDTPRTVRRLVTPAAAATVLLGWVLCRVLSSFEEPLLDNRWHLFLLCLLTAATLVGGLILTWTMGRRGDTSGDEASGGEVWPTSRRVRLSLFLVAALGTGLALLWAGSGARELWKIPSRAHPERRGWRLPGDPSDYVARELVLMFVLFAMLLLAVSLPFRSLGGRTRVDPPGTPLWKRTSARAAFAVVAACFYLLGDLLETLALCEVVSGARGGDLGDLDGRPVGVMQLAYHIKWLSLSLAVVLIAALWSRRTPIGPGAEKMGRPDATPKEDGAATWAPRRDRLGISVSGGGIRSASFALGALQALRGRGMLERAAYVTSVSGGGYTTSALEHLNRHRASDPQRQDALRRVRRRLNYLLTNTSKVLSALARLLLGVLVNVWIIYLVIFAVVRPIGWVVGMPLIQDHLRVDTPYVVEVVTGGVPGDEEAEAQWREDCDVGDTDEVRRPDADVEFADAESATELAEDHPGATAFALKVPTQCVRVVGSLGSLYATFDLETTSAGLVRFDDREASVVRQPEVSPTGVVLHGEGDETVKCPDPADPDDGASSEDEPASDGAAPTDDADGEELNATEAPPISCSDFTDLLITEDTLLEISAPTIEVADGGKVAGSLTPVDQVLEDPGPLSIGVRSIIDQRTKPVLDVSTRHLVVPLVPLAAALLLWMAGGSVWGQQLLRHDRPQRKLEKRLHRRARHRAKREKRRLRKRWHSCVATVSWFPIWVQRRAKHSGQTVRRWWYEIALHVLLWGGLAMLVLFVVLPWLVKEVPEGLTTFLTTGPSAEQTSLLPWMPAGLPPVVAWPVLAIGTVVGFFRQNKLPAPDTSKVKRNVKSLLSKVLNLLLRLAVALVLIILVVVSAVTILATAAANGPFGNRAWITQEMFGRWIPWPSDLVLWTGITAVLLLSRTWFSAGVWSLGAYYRNRLRWAFTNSGDERSAFVDVDGTAEEEGLDPDLFGRLEGTNAELVVCCAANIRGADRAPTGRNAVSFTISRSWVGGPELGWMHTRDYLRRLSEDRRDDLTIPSMTAISGAAVSPAMGKSSLGPVGAVLAVLNVRLGGWLPHPWAVRKFGSDVPWKHTPGWPYFLRETVLRYRFESPYVYVSDGGHWENLGLVEALRRGCNQIVAISAAGDGAFSHATIAQAVEIARTDLDIEIELDEVWEIRPLVGGDAPTMERREYLHQNGDSPTVGSAARQGFAVGRFTRHGVGPPHDTGTILLIEASMVDGLPVDVHAYAESHHEFPDISTGDQFFENADFEAYRLLGQILAEQALDSDGGKRLIRETEGQPVLPFSVPM